MSEQAITLTSLIKRDDVKQKFQDILGENASSFISSLITLTNQSQMLSKATPQSILMAGSMAATLKLPVNQSLGFAYIVPYNTRQGDKWEVQATFQIGYKGLIQLAQRSGMYKTINVSDVREGEIESRDRLTGEIKFNWNNTVEREQLPVIGFIGYFELANGFSKSLFMTIDELKNHGVKYSKTYSNEKTRKQSLWETDFNTMASKTVLKLLIGKYGPLSVDMQKAILSDHAVVKDVDTIDVDYVDNGTATIDEISENKEIDRVINAIDMCTTVEQLEALRQAVEAKGLNTFFNTKMKELC